MSIETRNLGTVDGVEIGLAESTLAGRFSQDDLVYGFDLVKNPEHWKGEIDRVIRAADRDVVAAAVEHFTATEAAFQELPGGRLRVTAPGYWAGPAN